MESVGNSNHQWLIFLLGAAALHGLWLAVLLFFHPRRQRGARLLSAVFLIISLYLLNYLLFLTDAIRSVPHLLGVFYPLFFLVGPAYYFFVRRSMAPDFRLTRGQLWHLLPAILITAKTLPFYLTSAAAKLRIIDWYLNPDSSFTWLMLLAGNDFIYHITAYVAAAVWLAARAENQQTEAHLRRDARWLKRFSLVFFLLLALDLAVTIIFFALQLPGAEAEYATASALALGIQVAGYRAIGRLGHFPEWQPVSDREDGSGKYKTSPLTLGQMTTYQHDLLALMKKEQPFLDPALKLSDLAGRLGIPAHHLSQVLNEGMATNFYDFVNAYRVEAVKRRLKDDKYSHYNILAIGLDCGFTNKTTFNRTFKKRTGLTPSAFARREKTAM